MFSLYKSPWLESSQQPVIHSGRNPNKEVKATQKKIVANKKHKYEYMFRPLGYSQKTKPENQREYKKELS